ncbi:UNVERIFIED_CONTAM: hypothetical protein RMT77_000598 [Armadillidium vulgare]
MNKISLLCYVSSVYLVTLLTYIDCDKFPYYIGDTVVEMEADNLPFYKPVLDLLKKELPGRKRPSTRPLTLSQTYNKRGFDKKEKIEKNISSTFVSDKDLYLNDASKIEEKGQSPSLRQDEEKPYEKVNKKDIIAYLKNNFKSNLYEEFLFKNRNTSRLNNVLNHNSNYVIYDQFESLKDVRDYINSDFRNKKIIVISPKRNITINENNNHLGNSDVINIHNVKEKLTQRSQPDMLDLSSKFEELITGNKKERSEETNLVKNSDGVHSYDNNIKNLSFSDIVSSPAKYLVHTLSTNKGLAPSVYKELTLKKDINVYDSQTGSSDSHPKNLSQTNDSTQIKNIQVTELNIESKRSNTSLKETEKHESNIYNSKATENIKHQEFAHPKTAPVISTSNHHLINQNQENVKPTKFSTSHKTSTLVNIPNQEYVPPKIIQVSHPSKSHITIPGQEYVPPKVSTGHQSITHVDNPNQEYVPPKITHTSHPSKPHITNPNKEYVPPKISTGHQSITHVDIPNQEYFPPKITHTSHPSKPHISIPSQEYVPPKISAGHQSNTHVNIPAQGYIPPKTTHTKHPSKPHIAIPSQEYIPPKITSAVHPPVHPVNTPAQQYVPPSKISSKPIQQYLQPNVVCTCPAKDHISIPNQAYIPPNTITSFLNPSQQVNPLHQGYLPPKITSTSHSSNQHITIPNQEYLPPKVTSISQISKKPISIPNQEYLPPKFPSTSHSGDPNQIYVPPNIPSQEYLPPTTNSGTSHLTGQGSHQNFITPSQQYLPPSELNSNSYLNIISQMTEALENFENFVPSFQSDPSINQENHHTNKPPGYVIAVPSKVYTEGNTNGNNCESESQNNFSNERNRRRRRRNFLRIINRLTNNLNRNRNRNGRPNRNKNSNSNSQGTYFGKAIRFPFLDKNSVIPLNNGKISKIKLQSSKPKVEDDDKIISQLRDLAKYTGSLTDVENSAMFNESFQEPNKSRNIIQNIRLIRRNLHSNSSEKPFEYSEGNEDHPKKVQKYSPESSSENVKHKNSEIIFIKTFRRELPQNHHKFQILSSNSKEPKTNIEKPVFYNSSNKFYRKRINPLNDNTKGKHHKILIKERNKKTNYLYQVYPRLRKPFDENDKNTKHYKSSDIKANVNGKFVNIRIEKTPEDGNKTDESKTEKNIILTHLIRNNEWTSKTPNKSNKDIPKSPIKDDPKSQEFSSSQQSKLTEENLERPDVQKIQESHKLLKPEDATNDDSIQELNPHSFINQNKNHILLFTTTKEFLDQNEKEYLRNDSSEEVDPESSEEDDDDYMISTSDEHEDYVTSASDEHEDYVTSASDEHEDYVTFASDEREDYVTSASDEHEDYVTSASDEREDYVTSASDEHEDYVTSASDEREDYVTSASEEHEDYFDYEDSDEIIERNYTTRRVGFMEYNKTALGVDQTCRCGAPQSNRIVGGSPTTILKYPWMVQQVFKAGNVAYCGGTIINNLYILTAAHCVVDTRPEEIYIKIGHTSPEFPGTNVDVHSFIIHRRYKDLDITKYDIALIKLMEPLKFSEKALPICLPTREYFNNEKGFITGWGTLSEFEEKISEILHAASVTIYEYETCRRKSSYDDIDLNKLVICAREKSIDACQGDSGGPLVYFDGESYSQVGITSWGIGCGRSKFPGVYTKVTPYYRWIRQRTRDATYCQTETPQGYLGEVSTTQPTQSTTTSPVTTSTPAHF